MPRKKNSIPSTIADISEFVINPITGNLLRIGSKTYNQLMKDNLLKMDHKTRSDPIILQSGASDDIKKNLRHDKDTILVKKNDKIYSQRRKLKTQEYINNTMLKSAEIIKYNLSDFTDDMTDDDIYKKVKQLIGQKMIGTPNIKTKSKNHNFTVSRPTDSQTYEYNEVTDEETDTE